MERKGLIDMGQRTKMRDLTMRKSAINLFCSALVSGMALAATPALAADQLLDFSGNVCDTPGGVCSDGAGISQSYGDSSTVDVQYRSLSGQGNSSEDYSGLSYWNGGYGDLSDVIWGGNGDLSGVPEIRFVASGGQLVTLNSFDMAGWYGDYRSSARVYDLAYNLLFDTGAVLAPSQGHLSFTPGVSNAGGLILQWGPSGYNAGLDNISFSFTGGGAVPEPATWALMILGIGAVGASLRRRQVLAATPA